MMIIHDNPLYAYMSGRIESTGVLVTLFFGVLGWRTNRFRCLGAHENIGQSGIKFASCWRRIKHHQTPSSEAKSNDYIPIEFTILSLQFKK